MARISELRGAIGHGVVYVPTGEHGLIRSVTGQDMVFVLYGTDLQSKLTRPEDLVLLVDPREE